MTHLYLIELIRKPISDRSIYLIRLLIPTLILIVSIKYSFLAPDKYNLFKGLPDAIQFFVKIISALGVITSCLLINISLIHDKRINRFYSKECELINNKSSLYETVSEVNINNEIMEIGQHLYGSILNTSHLSVIFFHLLSTILSILCVSLIIF
jgi:hypothetical protein